MHSYKKNVFPHVRNFTLVYGSYSCLIDGLFGPILMENLVCFFNCSLNFQAHALQFELTKVGYTNFAKFLLQSMSSKIKQAFEKNDQTMFLSLFSQFKLKIIFSALSPKLSFLFFAYLTTSENFCDDYYFSYTKECHKSG